MSVQLMNVRENHFCDLKCDSRAGIFCNTPRKVILDRYLARTRAAQLVSTNSYSTTCSALALRPLTLGGFEKSIDTLGCFGFRLRHRFVDH